MVETDAILGTPDVPFGRVGVPSIAIDQSEETGVAMESSTTARGGREMPRVGGPAGGPLGRGEPAIACSAIDGDSPRLKLETLAKLHATQCVHCMASTAHRNIVFGEGSPEASLMFIGEVPGEQEDLTGRPFVGPAGEKLDQMITAMGFGRDDVYITNVLKTRPPESGTPRPEETEACGHWLASQIAIIRPKVLVTLGGPASQFILGTDTGITRLRGSWGRYDVETLKIPVMPTYHPAYVLRRYTPEVRAAVWADLQLARDLAQREV